MRGESARAKFSSFSEDIFTLVSVLLATVFPDDLASCLAYKRRLPLCCTYDGDGNVAKDCEKKTVIDGKRTERKEKKGDENKRKEMERKEKERKKR